jgi:FO synthase
VGGEAGGSCGWLAGVAGWLAGWLAGCNRAACADMCVFTRTGASHGQELPPPRMEAIITAAGRCSRQRTTLYGRPPASQTAISLSDAGLVPLV